MMEDSSARMARLRDKAKKEGYFAGPPKIIPPPKPPACGPSRLSRTKPFNAAQENLQAIISQHTEYARIPTTEERKTQVSDLYLTFLTAYVLAYWRTKTFPTSLISVMKIINLTEITPEPGFLFPTLEKIKTAIQPYQESLIETLQAIPEYQLTHSACAASRPCVLVIKSCIPEHKSLLEVPITLYQGNIKNPCIMLTETPKAEWETTFFKTTQTFLAPRHKTLYPFGASEHNIESCLESFLAQTLDNRIKQTLSLTHY